ncbi:hypothetical protein BH24ACT5_BH24ACT5_08130 [soil metagenome]
MIGWQHRRVRRNGLIGVALGAAATVSIFAVAAAGSDSTGDEAPTGIYEMSAEALDAVRALTAGYPAPADAVAGGRIDVGLCFDQMGHHYADPATFGDGVLDAAEPEAFVYAEVDGEQQLVAVEWVSTSPGEVLGIPLHLQHDLDVWILHAWVGLDNPAGVLADHHPDLGTCPS